jgi:hypothetical protein
VEGDNAAGEDWDLLVSFFPAKWKQLARSSDALKGLRQDKSAEAYLRVLLLHLGCGFSMRETVARAREAQLAQISDVALLKRLRKGKQWLYQLCCSLFAERGIQPQRASDQVLRLVDSTVVKEPGKTGSLWRIHYSFQWPPMACDYFKITPVEGIGNGESLHQYPIKSEEYLLADRGYCQASGMHFVAEKRAYLTVRLNPNGIRLQSGSGRAFGLRKHLVPIKKSGQISCWEVLIPFAQCRPLPARLCVVRKSQAAIALAQRKLQRKASKNGSQLQPETLLFAQYVMVLTTFPEAEFPAEAILDYYRFRWQIELVFKRFKQIAQLGHLPKYDDDSAKAWLYGKLFVALLTEKLIAHATALSPWGYDLQSPQKPMA